MGQNISIKLSDIMQVLANNGTKVTKKQQAFINSCFQECDTKDVNGNACDKGDGLLTGTEKALFIAKIFKQDWNLGADMRSETNDIFNEKREDGSSTSYRLSVSWGYVNMETTSASGRVVGSQMIYPDDERPKAMIFGLGGN